MVDIGTDIIRCADTICLHFGRIGIGLNKVFHIAVVLICGTVTNFYSLNFRRNGGNFRFHIHGADIAVADVESGIVRHRGIRVIGCGFAEVTGTVCTEIRTAADKLGGAVGGRE